MKISQKITIVLSLLVVWLIACGIIIYRLNTYGAFASLCGKKTLEYIREIGQGDPGSVGLDQSYTQWALALNLTDASNYIKVGLSFADGKGVSFKDISKQDPYRRRYLPYYFQSPGTPVVIGTMIKMFGEKSVLPYFILVLGMHFLTTLLVCFLGSKFVQESAYVFGVGLLSMLSLPILDFDFGMGLFSSEPFAALFVVAGLIALSVFWTNFNSENSSYKVTCFAALGFGIFLGLATYFRDVYCTFAHFCFAVLLIYGAVRNIKLKQIVVFILVSSVVLTGILYPWQKRNQKYLGEFTMAGSSYCSFSRWHQIWDDYKESSKWCWDGATGLGNYLEPEKSKEIMALLDRDKKAGDKYAWKCYFEAICKKPWQALSYKLGFYDTLWFGQRCHPFIYIWCVLSLLSFAGFLWLTRFRFVPELWLFPVFLLFISPFVHYEHRYAQPFFSLVTPITMMYLIKYWRKKVI